MDLLNIMLNVTTVVPQQDLHQGSSAFISCTCNEQTFKEDFPMYALKTGHEEIDFLEYCARNNIAVCEFSKTCGNCTLEIKNCSRLSQREDISSECHYRSIKVQRGHQHQKTKITGLARRRRDLYQNSGCVFPNEMRTAELHCHIQHKSVTCRQFCMYGYTLDEGITKELKCYYKDKKWSGNGFKECLPFVDCTMRLVTGGNMSCEKNTVWRAPTCNVSCHLYEDKPATPMSTHTCTTEHDNWNPKLPHCVAPGSGFVLTRAPRIKEHSTKELEPEPKTKKSKTEK